MTVAPVNAAMSKRKSRAGLALNGLRTQAILAIPSTAFRASVPSATPSTSVAMKRMLFVCFRGSYLNYYPLLVISERL